MKTQLSFFILVCLCIFFQSSTMKKETGWESLFDGKTTKGWHNYGKKDISPLWKVEDGALMLSQKGAGDILTDEEYENYAFELEWKIAEGGNSGIYYLVNENPEKYQKGWNTGPEMQVLDDEKHPDATKGINGNHQAGALYDLIPPNKSKQLKPVGQWNLAKIVVNKGKVEHWLNGTKIVEYDLNSTEFVELVKASKFAAHPDFAKFRKGRIALQDHGDLVWYRNIRIKKL